MNSRLAWLGLLLALLRLAPGSAASAQEPNPDPRAEAPTYEVDPEFAPGGVTHVVLDGELDYGALGVLRRAADQARAKGDVLLIELDTPGGRIDLMWQLATAIEGVSGDGLLTVAWVNDHALSAGALVALVCDRIYMRAGATIGSSQPILPLPFGMGVEEVPEKFSSAFRGEFRAKAQAHGRSGALAEAMVDADMHVREVQIDGVPRILSDVEFQDANVAGRVERVLRTVCERGQLLNLTGNEAQELQLIDGLKENLADVVAAVHRRGTVPSRVERARSDDFGSWVSEYGLVLLFCGLLFGYAELKAPGFGIAGILSAACIGLFLAGRYLAGLADVVQILVVAAGAILLAVELFLVPGLLWPGVLGGLLVIAGLIWSGLGPGIGFGSPMERELLFDTTFETLLTASLAAASMYGLSRVLPHTPLLGRLATAPTPRAVGAGEAGADAIGAIGAIGVHGASGPVRVGARGRALTALRPVGMVVLDEHPDVEFEARSTGLALDRGARVRIVERQGERLVVEAEEH